MKILAVSIIAVVLISLHECSTCPCSYSCDSYNKNCAFIQNLYNMSSSTTVKIHNNGGFKYLSHDSFKEKPWKLQIISFMSLSRKIFMQPPAINNLKINKNYRNILHNVYNIQHIEQQFSPSIFDEIIPEVLVKRKILALVKKIDEISKIHSKKINILEKLLNIINEIYEKILKNSSFSQSKLIYVMKQCIYNICLKISHALDPIKTKSFEFQRKSFIINIFSTKFTEIKKHNNNFMIEILQQKQKRTRLLINFPSNLLFQMNNSTNNTSNIFLFQTIIWKFYQKKHVVSKIFSFDIFDKNTNELMKFSNLSRNFFQFLIPKSHSFQNIEDKSSEQYICQYFNTTIKKWLTNGCQFISFKKSSKQFLCECNHLTEFRVIAKTEPEKIAAKKVISVKNFYFSLKFTIFYINININRII